MQNRQKRTPQAQFGHSAHLPATPNNAGHSILACLLDGTGSLYGANATGGAYDLGFVFKLTPSNGGWTFTDLYDFTGGNDGGFRVSNVILDGEGNLYGTAFLGGTGGGGVAWEITP